MGDVFGSVFVRGSINVLYKIIQMLERFKNTYFILKKKKLNWKGHFLVRANELCNLSMLRIS